MLNEICKNVFLEVRSEEIMEDKIRESIKSLTPEEAIKDLEDRIFYEQMSEFMDFKFVRICEKIIQELKNAS